MFEGQQEPAYALRDYRVPRALFVHPVRTVFALIPAEEHVGTGEVDYKGPFHNFALAKMHCRVTLPHFAKFAFTVPSARVYLRTATPKGKEPHPSLPVWMLQQA